MAEKRKSDDSEDYREREINAGHIYEDENEFGEEEQLEDLEEPEQEDGDEEMPDDGDEENGDDQDIDIEDVLSLGKMKEMIMVFQLALKKKDIELLEAKKQNQMLLIEVKKISDQYVKDHSKEVDQLAKVKLYEEEFQKIQKEMQSKLAMVSDVHNHVNALETDKAELGKALVESTQINKQLKSLLQEKDKIIEKMQTEMEKFVSIKKEIEPMFKESGELKKQLLAKENEVQELTQSLAQATKIVEQVPNIEIYVKQAAAAVKEMGEENSKLKTQLTDKSIEVEQLKGTQEELKASLNDFLKKDTEIKGLFDMFEKALKTLSTENGEWKEKTLALDQENENFKSIVLEYQKELKEAREKLVDASKAYDELHHLYEKTLARPTAYFEGQRSEIANSEQKLVSKPLERDHREFRKSNQITEVRPSVEDISEDRASLTQSQNEYLYESFKPKRTEKKKAVKNLDVLRESNKLLKEQNESLRIRAMLMEEKTKIEKEDIGKCISESLSKAIKNLDMKKKEKPSIPDSDDSDSEKPRKRKSKSQKKRVVEKKKVPVISSERQSNFENFLYGQIEKLNLELTKEREWRDQVLQNSNRVLSAKTTPKAAKSVSQAEEAYGASQFLAFLKAANPTDISKKAESEANELNKVESTMFSAFKNFESRLKDVHSKVDGF